MAMHVNGLNLGDVTTIERLEAAAFRFLSIGDRRDVAEIEVFEDGVDSHDGALLIVPAGVSETSVMEAIDRGALHVVLEADSANALSARIGAEVTIIARPPGLGIIETLAALQAAQFEGALAADTERQPSDLGALAESLATLLGGPVVIEDRELNVLSYSTYEGSFDSGRDQTILGRRTSQAWEEHMRKTGILHTLQTTVEVVDDSTGPDNARRRIVTGLRYDNQFVGLLWLAEGEIPLAPDSPQSLRRAAHVAAERVVRSELRRRRRSVPQQNLARAMITGGNVALNAREEAGFDRASALFLTGLRARTVAPSSESEVTRSLDAMLTYCQAYRWPAVACSIGATVYIVADIRRESRTVPWDRVLESFVPALTEIFERTIGGPAQAIVCDPVERYQVLSRARERVDLAFSSLPNAAVRRVATFAELRGAIGLQLAAESLKTNPLLDFDFIDRLHEMDRGEDERFLPTVEAFIANGGSVRRTAESLDIHATTVRYRLRRVQSQLGLDLTEPETRSLLSLLTRPTTS